MYQLDWLYEVKGKVCSATTTIEQDDGYHNIIDSNTNSVLSKATVYISNGVIAFGLTKDEALDNYTSGNVEKVNNTIYFD